MTPPLLAAQRFLLSCLVGLAVGIWYDFLRPLRPKHTGLSDFVFLIGLYYAWLYQGFKICNADLRPGYTAGLFLGACGWEMTVGRLLRPVFSGFWKIMAWMMGIFASPIKKFLHFLKILFASVKKSVTI